jgi:hypothetical protein
LKEDIDSDGESAFIPRSVIDIHYEMTLIFDTFHGQPHHRQPKKVEDGVSKDKQKPFSRCETKVSFQFAFQLFLLNIYKLL